MGGCHAGTMGGPWAKTVRISLLIFSATLTFALYSGQCSDICAYAPYSHVLSVPLSLLAFLSFLTASVLDVAGMESLGVYILVPTLAYGYSIGLLALLKYSFLCPYCELAKASGLASLILNPGLRSGTVFGIGKVFHRP